VASEREREKRDDDERWLIENGRYLLMIEKRERDN